MERLTGGSLLDLLEVSEVQALGLTPQQAQQVEPLVDAMASLLTRKLGGQHALHVAAVAALAGRVVALASNSPGEARARLGALQESAEERALMHMARAALEDLETEPDNE